MRSASLTALTAVSLASLALGQVVSQCPGVPAALFPNYKVADGWSVKKVADALSSPRGIVLDNKGRLLVVERGKGITQHEIDPTGCITKSQMLFANSGINHGIYFSPDGKTLYSGNPAEVFSWPYDPETGALGTTRTTLVTGMATSGHVTRTLIIPPSNPNLLVVSHGSGPNFDWPTEDPSVGRAIVKVFNITEVPAGGFNYVTDGWNAGYGLRNEVGLAFDGDEMLWGVENSGDNLFRYVDDQSYDIHIDNPAEELNFLGDVTMPSDQWYGYPICWTVGQPASIPDFAFEVGQQMVQRQNSTFNDTTCAEQSMAPALTFQAHSAPLDSKFDAAFSNLYVTLHGSWNRDTPTGYKLVAVPFQKGAGDAAGYTYSGSSYAPVAPLNDPRGYTDIFFPENESACDGTVCLRPVGLVFDNQGRLYMTSDDSGEIFLLTKSQIGLFNPLVTRGE